MPRAAATIFAHAAVSAPPQRRTRAAAMPFFVLLRGADAPCAALPLLPRCLPSFPYYCRHLPAGDRLLRNGCNMHAAPSHYLSAIFCFLPHRLTPLFLLWFAFVRLFRRTRAACTAATWSLTVAISRLGLLRWEARDALRWFFAAVHMLLDQRLAFSWVAQWRLSKTPGRVRLPWTMAPPRGSEKLR